MSLEDVAMPNWKELKAGDRIRMISVPKSDLTAFAHGSSYLEETIDLIQRMISTQAVLIVERIDPSGIPWVDYDFVNDSGTTEYHSLAVWDNDSWVLVA